MPLVPNGSACTLMFFFTFTQQEEALMYCFVLNGWITGNNKVALVSGITMGVIPQTSINYRFKRDALNAISNTQRSKECII